MACPHEVIASSPTTIRSNADFALRVCGVEAEKENPEEEREEEFVSAGKEKDGEEYDEEFSDENSTDEVRNEEGSLTTRQRPPLLGHAVFCDG